MEKLVDVVREILRDRNSSNININHPDVSFPVWSAIITLARALDERLDKMDARIGALGVEPPESAPTRAELVERVREAARLVRAIDTLLAHEYQQP